MWHDNANTPDLRKICVQALSPAWLKKDITLDVLRLDLIHPVISGNKFFKLACYLEEAKRESHDTIATYGGAYSNHIAATALACSNQGFKSIGIIRGEQPRVLSHTLKEAASCGMELYFVSREAYRSKHMPAEMKDDVFLIPEGGFGVVGMKGAEEILDHVPFPEQYTHVVVAAGTGTTLAGIISSASKGQRVIGISVLKGNRELQGSVEQLLTQTGSHCDFSILHDFHFGGYAKLNDELLKFMRSTWHELRLPTDFVYTAKALFAIKELTGGKHFATGSSVLFIHTGGLQGNKSLPGGTLPF